MADSATTPMMQQYRELKAREPQRTGPGGGPKRPFNGRRGGPGGGGRPQRAQG